MLINNNSKSEFFYVIIKSAILKLRSIALCAYDIFYNYKIILTIKARSAFCKCCPSVYQVVSCAEQDPSLSIKLLNAFKFSFIKDVSSGWLQTCM